MTPRPPARRRHHPRRLLEVGGKRIAGHTPGDPKTCLPAAGSPLIRADPDKHVTIEFYERRMTGDLSDGGGIFLQPVDIVYQWHGTTDELANDLIEHFIRAVVIGGISPSRPTVVERGPRWTRIAYLAAARMFDA